MSAVRGGTGRFDGRRRNIRPRRNKGCAGLYGSRRPLPGLLQRLEFRNALANLFLLGGELLLLGRELIKLLLRGGELLLLGGKFLHAVVQGADVFRQFFQAACPHRRAMTGAAATGAGGAAVATSLDVR